MTRPVERPSDEDILAAIRDGARTHHIAHRIGRGVTSTQMRRRLHRLVEMGKVVRCPIYTVLGSIYWLKAAPPPAS